MKVVLVGAGGYGKLFADYLLGNENPDIELVGIVRRTVVSDMTNKKGEKIPVYRSLSDFYAKNTCDLVIISTPAYLHREQSICALEHNSYVLCEKPVATTVADAEKMAEAERKYGKFIAIGYQWSFSDAMLNLKKDILAGKMGKPVRLKTSLSYPRNYAYFSRGGGYAGRISKDGVMILDSIAANAGAHYLHNMLFVLGDTMDSSAIPASVEAECIRANNIENFDTCAMRITLKNGASLYYVASHAAQSVMAPSFVYEFENAVVEYNVSSKADIVAHFSDGREIHYGDPFKDDLKKVKDCIKMIKSGEKPVSSVESAIPHMKLIEALYRNVPVTEFPKDMKVLSEDRVYVEGLLEKIVECCQTQSLFSEKGYSFSQKYRFDM